MKPADAFGPPVLANVRITRKRVCIECTPEYEEHKQFLNEERYYGSKYGITLRDYFDLVERQEDRCAICKIARSEAGYRRWHLDHDHKTGRVRGLLCFNCNGMLGQAKDSSWRLSRAIEYMKPVLYVGGTYDLLHPGHLWQFKQMADIGKAVISVNTSEFTRTYKGVAPVQSTEERVAAIQATGLVHDVIVNIGGADSKPAILSVKPDFIMHGTDWTHRDGLLEQMGLTWDWLELHGIAMLYLDRLPGFSSTKERAKLLLG